MAEDFVLAAKECLDRGLTGYQCAQEEKGLWAPAATAKAPSSASSFEFSFPSLIDGIVAQEKAEAENSLVASQGIAKLFGSAIDFIRSSFSQYVESEGRKAKECNAQPAFCSTMLKYD